MVTFKERAEAYFALSEGLAAYKLKMEGNSESASIFDSALPSFMPSFVMSFGEEAEAFYRNFTEYGKPFKLNDYPELLRYINEGRAARVKSYKQEQDEARTIKNSK